MSAASNGHLVAQVRKVLEAARDAGQPAQGRPTLVKLTGATDHQVKRALAALAEDTATAGRPQKECSAAPGGPDAASPSAVYQATRAGDQPSTSASAPAGGKLVNWVGFVFGALMSIAANVLHTWLPATYEPFGWSPGVAPQIGATVWPIGAVGVGGGVVPCAVAARVAVGAGPFRWNRHGRTGLVRDLLRAPALSIDVGPGRAAYAVE